jgi:hypothetical protein
MPVLGDLPHRLGVVRQERRWGAEEPLVPGHRRGVVADGDPREQIYGHDVMLEPTRKPKPQRGRPVSRN